MPDKDALLRPGCAKEDRFFAWRDRDLIDKLKQQYEDQQEQTIKDFAIARCPRDGERFTRRELQGVTIDDCPESHGILLQKGELETLSERRGSETGKFSVAVNDVPNSGKELNAGGQKYATTHSC